MRKFNCSNYFGTLFCVKSWKLQSIIYFWHRFLRKINSYNCFWHRFLRNLQHGSWFWHRFLRNFHDIQKKSDPADCNHALYFERKIILYLKWHLFLRNFWSMNFGTVFCVISIPNAFGTSFCVIFDFPFRKVSDPFFFKKSKISLILAPITAYF